MGDFYFMTAGIVRGDSAGRETVMGRHGVGSVNENGKLCAFNSLVISGSIFPLKRMHKST